MGLDMFLFKKKKGEKIDWVKDIEIGCWRKANQIHHWFVDNIQGGVDDCEEYEVTKEKLEELYNICMGVLSNSSNAKDVLPTKGGFFFGSTKYDEYYFRDLKETVLIIEKVLKETDFENEIIIYTSSW